MSYLIVRMSRHRIVRSEATRLPRDNGDRDLTTAFQAPGLDSGGGAQTRPFLSYRVEPAEGGRVRLKISINGTNVVDQSLDASGSRTFNAVVEHGVLDAEENELRLFVPADPAGSVVVSDVIVTYTADEQAILPDDDDAPPPSGNGF